jgi:hypothetical protein
MKAITLLNIPHKVARTVQQRAKQRKTSLNKAVIELLEESAVGMAKMKSPVCYHDLDHLAGTWTNEEAAAFDKLIAEQRTIEKPTGTF